MLNLFDGIKTFIVSVAASVGVVTAPFVPATFHPAVQPSATPIVTVAPSANPSSTPSGTPLPLNGQNYIYIRGTYSYLGQEVKYLFLVPKRGGNFGGSIEGACEASANGDYAGGNGGKISGNVSGTCKILFAQYSGSTSYRGFLFPESKKIVIEIDNSPIRGPITINYE